MFSFLKSIENKSYIFSRFISVLIKPLLLFICLFFNFEEFGSVIAMVFLVSATNMALSALPIYRNLFIGINKKSDLKKKYFKNKYKSEILILFLISLILIIPVNLFFDNSIEIYLCSSLIFSIEKIYDEIQRFLILKKKFNTWAVITNLKNFTLIIFLLNPLMSINILFLAFVYFLINFLKLFNFIKLNFNTKKVKQVKNFITACWRDRNIFLMTYFLIFYNMGDKLIVGKLFKSHITDYIFLSNVMSLPLMTIFFFYISKYRIKFVKNDFGLKEVLLSFKFNFILYLTLFLVIIFVSVCYYLNISNLSVFSIILLFVLYLLQSYSLIVNEIVYWKKFYRDFLFFEFFFFLLFFFLFLVTKYFNFSLDLFLFNFLLLFLFKIILKIKLYLKKNNQINKL